MHDFVLCFGCVFKLVGNRCLRMVVCSIWVAFNVVGKRSLNTILC
jgi:hypothetical protein